MNPQHVIGGTVVPFEDYQCAVKIFFKYETDETDEIEHKVLANGVLIANDWILTNFHIVDHFRRYGQINSTHIGGDFFIHASSLPFQKRIKFRCKEIYYYNNDVSDDGDNDIALIKVVSDKSNKFLDRVRKPKLLDTNFLDTPLYNKDTEITVVSYASPTFSERNPVTFEKRTTTFPIIINPDENRGIFQLRGSMDKAIYKGDSGSGAFIGNTLVGLISKITPPSPNNFSDITVENIGYYHQWINDVIEGKHNPHTVKMESENPFIVAGQTNNFVPGEPAAIAVATIAGLIVGILVALGFTPMLSLSEKNYKLGFILIALVALISGSLMGYYSYEIPLSISDVGIYFVGCGIGFGIIFLFTMNKIIN